MVEEGLQFLALCLHPHPIPCMADCMRRKPGDRTAFREEATDVNVEMVAITYKAKERNRV